MMRADDPKEKYAMILANTIQHLLRNSDELRDILKEAHEEGYEILLTIFSGIIVQERRKQQPDNPEAWPDTFEFTEFDKDFLQSIGIQVPDK